MRYLSLLLILLVSGLIFQLNEVQAQRVKGNFILAYGQFYGQGGGGLDIYEEDKRQKKYPIYRNRVQGYKYNPYYNPHYYPKEVTRHYQYERDRRHR